MLYPSQAGLADITSPIVFVVSGHAGNAFLLAVISQTELGLKLFKIVFVRIVLFNRGLLSLPMRVRDGWLLQ